MRSIVLALSLAAFTGAAHANISDYCAAYARDFADLGQNSSDWQSRYNNAQASCTTRFSAFEGTSAKSMERTKPKPRVTLAAKIKAPEKPIAETKADAPPETKVAAKLLPKLEPGSAEWLSYCKQKYVSFDQSKGTYMSKTGVERKCLVTAE